TCRIIGFERAARGSSERETKMRGQATSTGYTFVYTARTRAGWPRGPPDSTHRPVGTTVESRREAYRGLMTYPDTRVAALYCAQVRFNPIQHRRDVHEEIAAPRRSPCDRWRLCGGRPDQPGGVQPCAGSWGIRRISVRSHTDVREGRQRDYLLPPGRA